MAADTPLKLLHISDLHICHPPHLQAEIASVMKRVETRLGERIDIEFASEKHLTGLATAVRQLDPAVICITGDVTTFGDRSSFVRAAQFVQDIKQRNDGTQRKIVATPGNHDVLASQLAALLQRHGFRARLVRAFFTGIIGHLRRLLRRASISAEAEAPLRNYLQFLNDTACIAGRAEVARVNGDAVLCVPFGSVSLDPLWINQGSAATDEFNRFRALLSTESSRDIIVALLHHNPISSPDVVEPRITQAYNSMTGASTFVQEMQRVGTDIILYGHQHAFSCCLMDFAPHTPGHVYLIGAPSATTGQFPGFNLVEIHDRYHASLQPYDWKPAGMFDVAAAWRQGIDLVFDSEGVSDHVTRAAQREIRHFQDDPNEDGHLWNEMYRPSAANPIRNLVVFGPRMKTVKESRLGDIRRLLQSDTCVGVQLLVSDPQLFEPLGQLSSDDRELLNRMWGNQYTWETQSRMSKEVLRAFTSFRDSLSPEAKKKLQIRVAHTLLPIGGAAKNMNDPSGVLQLLLLPVGVMDGRWKSVVRLERRHEKAVFSFYARYLTSLFEAATEV
ncbi:MAG: metallophosphoesterase family protein [Thermoanaerobaculia bacterium]